MTLDELLATSSTGDDTLVCRCGHEHWTTLGPCPRCLACDRYRPLERDTPAVILERRWTLLEAVDACPHRMHDVANGRT